ncbi:MAG: anion transporter [Planctomycetes bacterium]|nr:anion transporter [Planctomycetota bacterium]
MDPVVLIVFGVVYLGMLAGRLPFLAIDRTGVAVLGAIALLACGRLSLKEVWDAQDVPTLALLLGFMVLSAQLRLGGFYSRVTQRIAGAQASPARLLGLVIAVAGALSALLANDIVCLAMAPLLARGCWRRGLDPIPFLLALACASNVGSAATLIGNPQNMLIGQALALDFAAYAKTAFVPSVLGLGLTWGLLVWFYRERWELSTGTDTREPPEAETPAFNLWQTAKGLTFVALTVAAFLFTDWPREVLALAAAGLCLASRRMATRPMLGLVDWHLLLLFMGLFVVNYALQASGALDSAIRSVREAGIDPAHPGWLFGVTVALSNLVSNVPAVMLLLPVATHEQAGPILALASTLAGNLILVGSIANLIVAEQAGMLGLKIDWKTHARVGVPVTLSTLAVAAGWLWLTG